MPIEKPETGAPVADAITLEFDTQREDMLAFVQEYQRTSLTFQRLRTRARYGVPVLLAVIGCVLSFLSGFSWARTLVYLGVALLWFFLYPLRMDRTASKYIRKTLAEEGQAKAFGTYTLTLTATGLHSKGPLGEGTYYWDVVERVELTDTRLFIFLSGSMGWVVPVAQVGKEAAQAAYAAICARAPGAKRSLNA